MTTSPANSAERGAPAEVVGHVLASGVATWTGAGVIPARPEIGLTARLCVPIRWRSQLLGMVMVIDADASLTAEQVQLITTAAEDLAPSLAAALGAPEDSRAGERESAVADLLYGAAEERRAALRLLRHPDRSTPEYAVAIAIRALRGSEPATTPFVESVLRVALADPAAGSAGWRRHRTFRPGSATELLTSATHPSAEAVRQFTERICERVDRLAGGRVSCVAGIGDAAHGLTDAWVSARQADVACAAAGGAEPAAVVEWVSLGAAGVLLRLPRSERRVEALPHELQLLLRADPDRHLLDTLRAYLDAAGAGPAAAAALHIHRTTLY